MARAKVIRVGPILLTTTLTTNLVNCHLTSLAGPVGITSVTQPMIIGGHVRIVNRTGTSATFSLWLGASGANLLGTEIIGSGSGIPANLWFDWYSSLPIFDTDYLVGGAGTANALIFTMTGLLEFQ